MTFRIFTIVGARPQFIKAAALSRAFQQYPDIEEVLIHTGQHFDANMSDIFFRELNIPEPKYSLNINNISHGRMTGRMLEEIENILVSERPDALIVYGDTNSTLAGALAASKLHIPIIHIEAGLRSYNRKMPEEVNRVLTDHVSTYLFCPTKVSVENLKKEGVEKGIYQVGDIMYDATLYAIEQVKHNRSLQEKFSCLPEKFAFMTVHRAESTDNKDIFQKIIDYAKEFAKKNNLLLVFSVHPRSKKLINNKSIIDENFLILEPLSYFETQFCLSKACYVVTDSGGLQKEAYFHRVPCITLRTETEWAETITHGWNRLWHVEEYQPRHEIFEYGDGKCAEKIIDTLVRRNL